MPTVKTIGVIGAGTMGAGIAQIAAVAGFDVLLFDISQEILARGMERVRSGLERDVEKGRRPVGEVAQVTDRIHPVSVLDAFADADVIVEAAAEDITVKRQLFSALDELVAHHVIMASNTSSLSITAIAATTKHPAKVAGFHFFNPAPAMPLVEIVRGAHTSDETVERLRELAASLGKTSVVCRDTPGFIVNRVARPFYGEALRLLGEGVASLQDIDLIVRESGGFPMGPFELMDLIGIDVNYAVTCSVYEQFFYEPRFRPHPIQRRMVDAGLLGRKTKMGFYRYK